MKQLHIDLWQRINAFELDEPGALHPFSTRLAGENRWSPTDAKCAINEYKRFVFLGLVSGHPVAPSDAIDQVWHLHLTYTQSYWNEWCGKTLGQAFHHVPSRGGPDESMKHNDWYEKTLASYRDFFDEEPPKLFWPPVGEQFSPNHRFSRVNVNRNWIVAKPRIPGLNEIGVALTRLLETIRTSVSGVRLYPMARSPTAALLLSIMLLGCNSALLSDTPLDFKGPEFLDFFWKMWLVSLIAATYLRWRLRRPGDESMQVSDLRPDPYLVAYVHGRGVLAGNAAMASLVHCNYLATDKNGLLKKTSSILPNDLHPLQKAVMQRVQRSNTTRVADVRMAIAPELSALERQAEHMGLITPPRFRSMARWIPFAVAFSVPILGLAKIIIGSYRDKPVGFLVMLTILATVIALIGFIRDPYCSRLGSAWLRRIGRKNSRLKSRLRGSSQADQSHDLALAVGLFGTPVLGSLGHDILKQSFTPPSGSSSTGCGGSCGGGGGDGGGGCGGGD